MGWYAAIGRPLFFSLPPETAHRVANGLLRLPLPWTRLGPRAHDQRLRTQLCGIPLATPIGLAAGFDKRCAHLGHLGALGFGYVVGGTITRAAREGNPRPRIARSPAARSMVNAMGMPNPGAEAAAANLDRDARHAIAPRFVSVADEDLDDARSVLEQLAPRADGIEINASCPNVAWGRDRDNEAHLRALVRLACAVSPTPVMVKLPPFITDVEREVVRSLARVAHEAGAGALTCSNTRAVADERLATKGGGLSGKALWPHTARIVHDVREATDGAVPINACGGVSTADDVLTCLEAGASTVQIYSALIYEGPSIVRTIAADLAERLATRGRSVADLAPAAGPSR